MRELTCQEAFARLDDYVDRELSDEEIAEVRAHLEACPHCDEVFRFEASVLSKLKGKAAEVRCPEALTSRVFSALDECD